MTNQSIPIDPYGNGLNVLICCNSLPAHVWLSYVCYYSVRESLPDAKIGIACLRPQEGVGIEGFPWVFRTKTPFFYYKSENDDPQAAVDIARSRALMAGKILTIPCDSAVIRPLDADIINKLQGSEWIDGKEMLLEAKKETLATFCSLKEGCGRFVLPSWLHKQGHPLGLCDRFAKGNLTANERRVFNIWRKARPLFDLIG